MDARVSARFYTVTAPGGGVDFHDLLLAEMNQPNPRLRERGIGDGVTVRLENCEMQNGFLEGQFCRVQTVNVPPRADADGLTPIPLGNGGLGHVAAFSYHVDTRIMLLQQNIQSATPHRISLYVAAPNPAHTFVLNPLPSQDAWDRFANGDTRAFTVRFAGIDRLDALDGADVAAGQGVRMLAEAYEGVQVTIEVSVGRARHRRLHRRVFEDLARLAGLGVADKMTARMEGDTHPVDLLHEHLRIDEELDLDAEDPAANYDVRKNFLRRGFVVQREALRRHGFGN